MVQRRIDDIVPGVEQSLLQSRPAANFVLNGHSFQPKFFKLHLFLGENVAKKRPFAI